MMFTDPETGIEHDSRLAAAEVIKTVVTNHNKEIVRLTSNAITSDVDEMFEVSDCVSTVLVDTLRYMNARVVIMDFKSTQDKITIRTLRETHEDYKRDRIIMLEKNRLLRHQVTALNNVDKERKRLADLNIQAADKIDRLLAEKNDMESVLGQAQDEIEDLKERLSVMTGRKRRIADLLRESIAYETEVEDLTDPKKRAEASKDDEDDDP